MKSFLVGLCVLAISGAAFGADINSIVRSNQTPYEVLEENFLLGRPAVLADFSTLAETASGKKIMLALSADVVPTTTSGDLSVSPDYVVALKNIQTTVVGATPGTPGTPSAGPLFPGTPGTPGDPGTTLTTTTYVLAFVDPNLVQEPDAGLLPVNADPQGVASYTLHFTPQSCTAQDPDASSSVEYREYNGMVIGKMTAPGANPPVRYSYGWIQSN